MPSGTLEVAQPNGDTPRPDSGRAEMLTPTPSLITLIPPTHPRLNRNYDLVN
jgi:hypothetical protein